MRPRERADWLAHLWKASTQQHHGELRKVFARWIGADAVVVDVGAHAGQFSKLFARMAPEGLIYAFEPSDYARSILLRALAWNGLRNVRVVPQGLSDQEGWSVLHTPVKAHGGLGFGLAHLGLAPGRETVDKVVPLTTLDLFAEAEGLSRMDFVKVDVEGWEAHVLRGGRNTVRRFRPALFLEVIEASLQRAGAGPDEIWSDLRALGYQALRAPDFTPVEAFAGPGDYLFAPPA